MQVNRCITDILKLCKEFCLEMSKEDISDESLKAMIERLDLSVSMLMSFITLLGGKAEGLRLLLLRLDYNRFFSLRSSWTQTRHSCQVNHSSTQEDVLHSVYSRSSKAVDMKYNSIRHLVASNQYQLFASYGEWNDEGESFERQHKTSAIVLNR